jgi:CCR4-NOT transcription complex subunit 1
VAALSSKELLCKDFASEPDETSLRSAGDAMVKSLAGNLALVTSKEPVRNSLLENVHAELLHHGMPAVSFPFTLSFRDLLQTSNNVSQADAKEVALIFVSDNIDTVCAFIEKASVDKAFEELHLALAPSFAIRRQYREVCSC